MEARFRHRPQNNQNVTDLHNQFLANLKNISWLWKSFPKQLELSTSGESSSFTLTPFLNFGLRGSIMYSPRYKNKLPEKSMFDDILILEFDENKINYPQFSGVIFEEIVSAFDAYRASIVLDLDLDLDDFEKIVELSQDSKKDIDGRDSVFRFQTINYFDNELCQKAFGLSAKEVKSRLSGEVEKVALQNDGVLIIVTSEIVDRENLEIINDHISGLLE